MEFRRVAFPSSLPFRFGELFATAMGIWSNTTELGVNLMNDRPTAVELIAAARVYLEQELIPTLTDARLRFQTLVAANVLAIAERDLATEEAHLAEEWRLLSKLLNVADTAPDQLSALRHGVLEKNRLL